MGDGRLGDNVDTVVLAGGEGVRLRPLTLDIPKPMLPCAGGPILERVLTGLERAGAGRIVCAAGFMGEVVAAYVAERSSQAEVVVSIEPAPLGTGGGLRSVLPELRTSVVFVVNGDTLSQVNYRQLLRTHMEREAELTVHLTEARRTASESGDAMWLGEFGTVSISSDGRVTAFDEKPRRTGRALVSAGTYVINRELIERLPVSLYVSLEVDVFPRLVAEGARVYGDMQACHWIDTGTPDGFIAANLHPPFGEGSAVGAECEIGSGVVLEDVVLFDHVVIDDGATVRRSIVASGAHVESGCVVEDAIIGARARIGANSYVRGHTRIWPDVVVETGAALEGFIFDGRPSST